MELPTRDIDTWWLTWSVAYLAAGWLVAAAAGESVGRAAAVLAGVFIATAFVGEDSRPVWPAVTVLALWLAGRWPTNRVPPGLGWLDWLGRHAYAIYLTHSTVGSLVLVTSAETGLTACVGGWVAGGAAAAAALLVGYAFRRWVQLPLGRLM